ncbi:MAG: hypothetical protein KAG56_05455, partial [Sulfurovaceae bacterium]|nr:hypothetical protein [Sulfurovaceae bacterium]
GQITFTPLPTFRGDPTPIKYVVSDEQGQVSQPNEVTIDYLQLIPKLKEDSAREQVIGEVVTIKVLENDDSENPFDISSVKIVSPTTGLSDDGKTLEIPSQGVWSVDDEGSIKFTPEDGFTGDPTPIKYVVSDEHGQEGEATDVIVDYNQLGPNLRSDNAKDQEIGKVVTIDVLKNDVSDNTIDTDSVKIVSPTTGLSDDGKTLTVPNEGTWSVEDNGAIKFTPERGFEEDPTPITYVVSDDKGLVSNEVTVVVDYKEPKRTTSVSGYYYTPPTYSDRPSKNEDTEEHKEEVTEEDSSPAPVEEIKEEVEEPTEEIEEEVLVVTDNVATMQVGDDIVIDILENDTGNFDRASLVLVIPEDFKVQAQLSEDGKTLEVDGEGVWSVDENGILTFTPEEGFVSKPTDILYMIANESGEQTAMANVSLNIQAIEGVVVEGEEGEVCQTSDNVPALSKLGAFLTMLLIGMFGMFIARKE